MAGADSNLEDSFVEDKIIDVLPGCSSSPAGKQSCPSYNQVYEFLSHLYIWIRTLLWENTKNNFVGKNEGHERDPTTIYDCLNKLYKRVTYNLRGESRAEFLKKKFTKRQSKAAFLSEVLNDSPPQKVKLGKELQKKNKSNLEVKRKLDDSIVVIEELDNEIKLLTNEYETKINNMALME